MKDSLEFFKMLFLPETNFPGETAKIPSSKSIFRFCLCHLLRW